MAELAAALVAPTAVLAALERCAFLTCVTPEDEIVVSARRVAATRVEAEVPRPRARRGRDRRLRRRDAPLPRRRRPPALARAARGRGAGGRARRRAPPRGALAV